MSSRRTPNENWALDQDIGLYGYGADDFLDELCREFGDWICDWPWDRFIKLNEDAAGRTIAAIWRKLRLPNVATAVPGNVTERLELGHIVAAIEKGEWFEP